jgi:hypothetical protein
MMTSAPREVIPNLMAASPPLSVLVNARRDDQAAKTLTSNQAAIHPAATTTIDFQGIAAMSRTVPSANACRLVSFSVGYSACGTTPAASRARTVAMLRLR